MNIVNRKVLTIKEAIELCIEKEVEGAEAQLVSFTKNKKLATNQKVKLQKNLECLFNEVVITGGGQKGECILTGLKETPTEREYKYVGTVETHDESEMKEFMFNQLLEAKGSGDLHFANGSSYNGWANYFGFFSSKDNPLAEEQLVKLLNGFHGIPSEKDYYKPYEIVENFNEAIYDTRKASVKNAFNRLRQEGRISIEEIPMEGIRSSDDKRRVEYSITTADKYKEMKVAKEKLILEMGSTLAEYNRNINKRNKPRRIKDVFDAVDKMLEKDFGVVRFHLSYKVTIINTEIESNTNFTNLNYHFFNRLTKLAKDRKNKIDYKTSTYFWRRFYLLNLLLIQKEVLPSFKFEELLKEEKKSYQHELNCYYEDCRQFEENEPKEERTVYGFGVDSAEPKKKEVPAELKDTDIIQLIEASKQQEVKVLKEVKTAQWIDIAAISTEVEPEEVVVKIDNRFAEMVEELDRARDEKRTNKLDSSLLPKSGEAKFKFTGYNITELSLRGFGS